MESARTESKPLSRLGQRRSRTATARNESARTRAAMPNRQPSGAAGSTDRASDNVVANASHAGALPLAASAPPSTTASVDDRPHSSATAALHHHQDGTSSGFRRHRHRCHRTRRTAVPPVGGVGTDVRTAKKRTVASDAASFAATFDGLRLSIRRRRAFSHDAITSTTVVRRQQPSAPAARRLLRAPRWLQPRRVARRMGDGNSALLKMVTPAFHGRCQNLHATNPGCRCLIARSYAPSISQAPRT
jgi:hypothetical protein